MIETLVVGQEHIHPSAIAQIKLNNPSVEAHTHLDEADIHPTVTESAYPCFRAKDDVPNELSDDDSEFLLELFASATKGLDEYLTTAEVAAILRISTDTVIRRFENLPGVLDLGSEETMRKRRYRTLRIPMSAVKRFIAEHRTV